MLKQLKAVCRVVLLVLSGEIMSKLKFFLILMAIVGVSYAGTTCNMVPGGTLDQFQQNFYNLSRNFTTNILPKVQKIYWMLWALWGGYELAFEKIAGLRIDKLLIWWFVRLITATIIYHIFLNPSFYIGVIKFGASFGALMGGFTIDPSSASLLGNFTPSAIMGINSCVATAVDNASKTLGSFEVLRPLQLLILQMLFYVITTVAALYVLYLSIRMWLCLFAGFVNTMFAGSRWTIGWWQAYLATVMKYALELMFTAALFGTVYQQMDMVVAKLSAASADILANYGDYLVALANTAILTVLMFIIPQKLASDLGSGFGSTVIDIGGEMVKGAQRIISSSGGGGGGGGNNTPMPIPQNPSGGGSTGGGGGGGGSGGTNPPVKSSDWAQTATKAVGNAATGQNWKTAVDAVKK